MGVDSVVDEFDFFPWIAGVGDVVDEGPGIDDDSRRTLVEPSLKCFKGAQGKPLLQLPQLDDGLRPEVTDFKHEGETFDACDHSSREPAEELGGRCQDQIGVPDPLGCDHCRYSEKYVVQDSLGEAGIGREEHPSSDHSDTVDFLLVDPSVVVPSKEDAGRMIRYAGDHGHFMTFGHPTAAVLVGAIGRGVDLGREVVANK